MEGERANALHAEERFGIYRVSGGETTRVGTMPTGRIARLPEGTYRVISRVGGVNAVRSADVAVEAGKLTRVSVRHDAGKVRLKLVRDQGGEALAATEWTVYGADGEPVFEQVGAHADVVLEAGEYTAEARHRDRPFKYSFKVRSGTVSEVEVVADRL